MLRSKALPVPGVLAPLWAVNVSALSVGRFLPAAARPLQVLVTSRTGGVADLRVAAAADTLSLFLLISLAGRRTER